MSYKCLVILAIIFGVVVVESLLLVLLNFICLGYFFLSLAISVILHIIFARYIILHVIFIGGFGLFQKYVYYSFNKAFCKELLETNRRVAGMISELLSDRPQSYSNKSYSTTISNYYNRIARERKIFDKINSFSDCRIKATENQRQILRIVSYL